MDKNLLIISTDISNEGDANTDGRPEPPTVISVGACQGSECYEGEDGKFTVNGQDDENLTGNGGTFRAAVKFFAYADSNQMPIRNVIVDWGDGDRNGSVYTGYAWPLDSQTDLSKIEKRVRDILSIHSQIKFILLREFISNESAKDKISGRVLFLSGRSCGDRVVEIYKGSRSTDILNTADTEDPNFLIFEKLPGRFMRPKKKKSKESKITEAEIKDIFNILDQQDEKFELAKESIALYRNLQRDEMDVCFEFAYISGHLLFVDFDF